MTNFSVTVSLLLVACTAATHFTRNLPVDSDYNVCLNSFMAIVKPILDFSCSGTGCTVICSLYHGIFMGLFVLRFVDFSKKNMVFVCRREEKAGGGDSLLVNGRKQVCQRKEGDASSSRFVLGTPSLMLLPGY